MLKLLTWLALTTGMAWAEGGHGDQTGTLLVWVLAPAVMTALVCWARLAPTLWYAPAVICLAVSCGELAYVPLSEMSWIGALMAPFLIAPVTAVSFLLLSRPRLQPLVDLSVLAGILFIARGCERDPSLAPLDHHMALLAVQMMVYTGYVVLRVVLVTKLSPGLNAMLGVRPPE